MSTTFFTFSVFGAGKRATITGNNGLYVSEGATVGSTDDYAIAAGGSNISIQVDGTLYGDLGGLTVTGCTHMVVEIGENGGMGADLTSGSAMNLTDFGGRIENGGDVVGWHAIQFLGDTDAEVSNFGAMSTKSEAVLIDGAATGRVTFFNYGSMTAGDSSSDVYDSRGNTRDQVVNSGVMNGGVDLGDKNDAYFGALAKPADVGQMSILAQLEGMRGKIACFVNGGDGNDLMYGSKYIDYLIGGSGRDFVSAGDGDDFVIGYTGPDVLSGGKGYDRFMYLSAADSHGSKVDRVTDFQAKYDQFDFSSIDADTLKNKDQAFHFIGAHNFSGKPGELRFEFQHGDTIVLGNTDHDHQAELEVRVEGHITLHADDFIL